VGNNIERGILMDLLHEITRCPNIQQWFASPQSSNPCAKIISVQHSRSLNDHQVPEPWSGDLEHAPILFLSSNPSFDEEKGVTLWLANTSATLFSYLIQMHTRIALSRNA